MVTPFIGAILLLQQATNAYEPWDDTFEHSTYLDVNDKYKLHWNVLEDKIEIGIEIESQGWFGFGVSSTGMMVNADIVMGWITDDGTAILQNRYTTNTRTTPVLMEDQSNINLIEAWRDDNKLYFHFTRLIHPCSDNTIFIPTGTARIIFAWNDNIPVNDIPQFHGSESRGSKSINLLMGETTEVPLPNDVEYFDLLMDNYAIPSTDTTYYCKLVALPALSDIHHIIRIDPIVTPGNEGVVHHTVLFGCPQEYVDEDEIGMEEVCDNWANMPTEASGCLAGNIFAAWAIGGGNFYFPEHVGYEFGGSDEHALKYAVIQLHYDNPMEMSGIIDSSGFRVYHTPTLREYSAEMLSVGANAYYTGLFVPPGIDTVTATGVCSAECTQNRLPTEGVYAFSNFLHGHVITDALKLRHMRGNEELAPLDRNDAYDFDYQQMWILPEERHILPGDQLLLECNYSSINRDFMTWGGESTRHEMCVSFVYIYPKTALSTVCESSWNYVQFQQWWTVAVARGYATRGGILDYDSYTYDASTPEAQQYYHDFWDIQKTPARTQFCGRYDEPQINIDINSDFEVYPEDTYCDSLVASNYGSGNGDDGNDHAKWVWNSWYGYIIILILVCGMISILLYGCFKLMKRKRNDKDCIHSSVPLKNMKGYDNIYQAAQ